ncbi:MAG: integration host factor subunit beta [Gammaproteobacteria bacterium]|nr:integration host factor subunit beta [Gammaproteobacteria bacterium]
MSNSVVKSQLIEQVARSFPNLSVKDIELTTKIILSCMEQCLAAGERIELRGFGSFSLRHHVAKKGRNPKTGETMILPDKYVAYFRPGKDVREAVK